jgi:hypothetical protein
MQKNRAATHENVAMANSRRQQWISKAHRHTRQLATVFWSQLGIYNLHCRRVQFLGRSTILSSLGLRLLGLPELGLQFPRLRPKKSSGFSLPWYSLHWDHGLLEACIRNIEYLEYLRAHRVDCPFFKVVKIAHIIPTSLRTSTLKHCTWITPVFQHHSQPFDSILDTTRPARSAAVAFAAATVGRALSKRVLSNSQVSAVSAWRPSKNHKISMFPK